MKTAAPSFNLDSIANRHVRGVKPYVPGKPIEEVAREFGLKKKDIVKLASNENPLGPSPKAIAAIKAIASEAHLYPDGTGRELRERIAERWKIQSKQVILGNGSNEVLEFLATAFLREGDTLITAENTFSLYETFATAAGAKTISVPLKNFTFDLEAIARQITPSTKMVVICNPNNPTGTVVTHDALKKFIAGIKTPTLVVIDEAYGDFRDNGGFEKSLEFLNLPNVILLRTFSKSFGLAGLRIGYGLANAEIIGLLNRVRQPFNVNKLAQAAALAGFDDAAHEKKTIALVRDGKKVLYPAFKKMNLPAIPTQANFICVKVGNAKQVFQKMQAQGVIIRPLDSFGMPEYIRVTIGTPAQNKRFLEVLKNVL